MATKYFDSKCTEVCRALVDMAKEHGWTGSMFDSQDHPEDFLVLAFTDNNNLVGWRQNHTQIEFSIPLTLEEVVAVIKAGPKEITKEMDFTIRQEKVVVCADQLQVGCTTVPYEQVKAIYDAMQKLKKEQWDCKHPSRLFR